MPLVIGATNGACLLRYTSMTAECIGSRPSRREQSKNVNKEYAPILGGSKSELL